MIVGIKYRAGVELPELLSCSGFPPAFTNDHERRPEHRMCVVRLAFVVHRRQDCPAVGLCAADPGFDGLRQHAGRDLDRDIRCNGPMGYQQGPRPRVEECLRESGQPFGPRGAVCRRRVARGKDHPIGVETEFGHLACGQQAVVQLRALTWRCQHEGGLGKALEVTRDESMRGESDNAVVIQGCLFEARFGCFRTQQKVAVFRPKSLGHRLEFVRRVGKRSDLADALDVGDAARSE